MDVDIITKNGFELMYQTYYHKIYNYVFYQILSKEDTEDIVSDVFMKVAKNAHQYDSDKAKFSTWLYRIAKNTVIDFYRKRKVEYSLEDNPDIAQTLAVEFEVQREQLISPKRKQIYAELQKLNQWDRLIIYYKFFEGYTNRQIALIMEMNESTVGTVVSRALAKLRVPALKNL